jgi:hypothetical protein
MILIYTTENDHTVNNVIDWLIYFNIHYERVNSVDFIFRFEKIFYSSKIDDVHWFWKWSYEFPKYDEFLDSKNYDSLKKSLKVEYDELFNCFWKNIKGIIINNPLYLNIDKFSVANIAKKNNLNVPISKIISTKESLINFKNSIKSALITKNFKATLSMNFEGIVYSSFTSEIDEFVNISQSFFPSLVQEKIDADFEIRVFVIENNFYSYVICKSLNEIDVRKSINSNSTNILFFELPKEICNCISNLMKDLKIQIGSVDLLYKDGNYFFLEINPSGEFLGFSEVCNSNLDKQIAQYLISKTNEEIK